MKVLPLFVAIWVGLTVALLAFLQSEVTIPAEQMLDYRVGSAALALVPAGLIAGALKKAG